MYTNEPLPSDLFISLISTTIFTHLKSLKYQYLCKSVPVFCSSLITIDLPIMYVHFISIQLNHMTFYSHIYIYIYLYKIFLLFYFIVQPPFIIGHLIYWFIGPSFPITFSYSFRACMCTYNGHILPFRMKLQVKYYLEDENCRQIDGFTCTCSDRSVLFR